MTEQEAPEVEADPNDEPDTSPPEVKTDEPEE
jgi:hypothetical protein